MRQRIGCYRKNYIAWEAQHKQILHTFEAEIPAQALLDVISAHDFRVDRAFLSRGRLSQISWTTQTILIDRDFQKRLQCGTRYQEALNSTLCFQLAHVVLHKGKRPQSHHDTEAWVWTILFLCPWSLLKRSHDLKALERGLLSPKQRWQKIYGIAEWLEVSPSLVKMALELYGVGDSPSQGRAA